MDAVSILTIIALTQFITLVSLGPTFVVVTNYAVAYSRKTALQMISGVLAAMVIWAVAALWGLGVVISKFPFLYFTLQIMGALYLIYLGIRLVHGAIRGKNIGSEGALEAAAGWKAVRVGFLTNITNPKAAVYYASVFAALIPPDSSTWIFVAAFCVAFAVSASWWVTVALLFSVPSVRGIYESIRKSVDLLAGGVLIVLGVRIAMTR